MADPEGNVFCLDRYPTGSVSTVGLTQPRKRPPVRADGGRSCARKGCHVDAPEDWFIPVCSHRSLPTASAFTRQGQPQQPPDPPFHVAYPAGHEPPQAPERRVL